VPILQTGPVTERLRVREIDDDEGRRLVRIVRRDSGSVVIWRRAQMVLLSAQGMDAAEIAKVAFTSEDRVRDVIRNFNVDGDPGREPRPRMRATYTRTQGVRHLFAADELGEDKLFGHVKPAHSVRTTHCRPSMSSRAASR
jgi:Homeodomain-like domain-containing protein